MNGREALSRFTPEAAESLDHLENAIWDAARQAGQLPLAAEAVRRIAAGHGLAPVPGAPEEEFAEDAATATGLGFAEQMSFDVTRIHDEQRQEFLSTFGNTAIALVQIFYVADILPRVRFALDAIFGTSEEPQRNRSPGEGPGLDDAFNQWIAAVPSLDALDPILTEMVRLRGAGYHQCRLCQSIRYLPALEAGAPDPLLDDAMSGNSTAADPMQKAALALVDEILARPGRLRPETIEAINRHFEPAARVELVLDIARNATNKVAVAFAADTPRVARGYEICASDSDGTTRYGLADPRKSP